jgi:hypothetical protein
MYTYQSQQEAHQKVVKASAKNQNKVILQQILNDTSNGGGNVVFGPNGTIIGGGQKSGGGTYQMTLDQSGEARNMTSSLHHKTKSHNIFQWTTGGQGTEFTGGGGAREKSNDHLQNEIMRLIVEDQSSFQDATKLLLQTQPQLWSATPQNLPSHHGGGINQSFNNKRQSLPTQLNSSAPPTHSNNNTHFLANYNILDQIK